MYARNKNQLFGRCRCCLDFGYHAEIHRETFLETFNLFLSTNPSLTTMICKLCIDRLNDATEFKAMVVKSEQQLLSKAEGTTSFEFRNGSNCLRIYSTTRVDMRTL
ncbi:zinc-finger associated domain (zf-AD) domain-containing protein [Phthorimaea operculella]|nr:zinc-finger associated domain (zf-AD) domain-containing protein [Phthorimaea operculella]